MQRAATLVLPSLLFANLCILHVFLLNQPRFSVLVLVSFEVGRLRCTTLLLKHDAKLNYISFEQLRL